jgi:hypothetical protein
MTAAALCRVACLRHTLDAMRELATLRMDTGRTVRAAKKTPLCRVFLEWRELGVAQTM